MAGISISYFPLSKTKGAIVVITTDYAYPMATNIIT
jgi:hypothetical protein